MPNPYYDHTSGVPPTQTRGTSANQRAEFDAIGVGFDGVYAEILALAAAIGIPTTVTEVDVASSATTDIGNGYGPVVRITGNAAITSFGAHYNGAVFLRFAGVLTLTNSSSLICPGADNITTVAGDACIAVPIGNPTSGWRIMAYCRMSLGLVDDVAVRTSSTYANPSWLTSLAWSKLTGTPTTLAGYGITDAPTKTGSGASGSWGIDITGNATTSTTATTVTGSIASAATATTQSVGDNSTKIASTAYTDRYGDRIQPISAAPAANAMTITVNPTVLDFRSATLGSGTNSTVAITAAISTVISSGSTGGTTSGSLSRIAVAVINNAGTPEVAWRNADSLTDISESGVISTTAEGGAGAADSGLVWYSTTSRANVSHRIVGYFESTQATAGTWATQPSKIQGAGGSAIESLARQGLTKLASGTVSSSATLDVLLVNFTGYRNFLFRGNQFIPATDGVDLGLRFSTNGGSSYDASGYAWEILAVVNSVGSGTDGSSSDIYIRLGDNGTAAGSAGTYRVGNGSDEGITFSIELNNPSSTSRRTECWFESSQRCSDALQRMSITRGAWGMRDAVQDTDAIRLLFSSGNISSGNWELYGYN